MSDVRVVVVDENQRFGEQLVSAFSEIQIVARSFLRGPEAWPAILQAQPALLVVDWSRPGSEGRWLLRQVFGSGQAYSPMTLVLASVTDDLSTLPESVEVLVRPVFPGQVVSHTEPLLKTRPTPSVRQATLRGLPVVADAVHTVPPSSKPLAAASKPAAGPPTFSEFEPGKTVLARESIAALARDMMSEPTGPEPDDDAIPLQSGDFLPFSLQTEDANGAKDARPASGRFQTPPTQPTMEAALFGELSVLPLFEAIDLLSRQQQTGLLTVQAQNKTLHVYFLNGLIAQAMGQGFAGLGLGRFLQELKRPIHPPEVDAVVAKVGGAANRSPQDATRVVEAAAISLSEKPGELLGQLLVQAGILRKEDLSLALGRQSTQLVFEGLRFSQGTLRFERLRELPPHVKRAELGGALQLDPGTVLLEGQLRNEDWRNFERDLQQGAVYVNNTLLIEEAQKLGLSQQELQVLTFCTGKNTVADLAREARLPLAEVSRTVSRLLALRVIRRRLPAVVA